MEENSFKKMSVMPKEKDFMDAILSLNQHHRPALVVPKFKKSYRHTYVQHVRSAQRKISGELTRVLGEFLPLSQIPTEYFHLLCERFDPYKVSVARTELSNATLLNDQIVIDSARLMSKDDCDSLDKCKRIKVAALGCMYTVAMRCIPILAYMEKVRQYMVNLEDDKIAAAAATFKNKKVTDVKHWKIPHDDFDVNACKVPHAFNVNIAADLVRRETLYWLGELEREHGMRLRDEEAQSEHRALPTVDMKALVI